MNASTTADWVNEASTPENSAIEKIARNGGTFDGCEDDEQHERQQVDRGDVERRVASTVAGLISRRPPRLAGRR